MPLITHAPEMALALEQAERSVAASGRALVAGDPQQLHAAALELQDSAVRPSGDFSSSRRCVRN